MSHSKRQTFRVSYDLSKDPATNTRFRRVGKACEILATSERIWSRRKTKGSAKNERNMVRVGRLEKPGIETNVEVWGIDSGEATAYFFPEAVLVLEDDRDRAFSYKTLQVAFASEKIAESGKVISDTEVLGETYRYTLSDGTPDRRFGSNPRLPEVLYGDLDLSADGWEGMSIRASNESTAAQFVLAFAEERDNEQWRGSQPAGDRGRLDPTHEILGLHDGASKSEVTVAWPGPITRTRPRASTESFGIWRINA